MTENLAGLSSLKKTVQQSSSSSAARIVDLSTLFPATGRASPVISSRTSEIPRNRFSCTPLRCIGLLPLRVQQRR